MATKKIEVLKERKTTFDLSFFLFAFGFADERVWLLFDAEESVMIAPFRPSCCAGEGSAVFGEFNSSVPGGR